MASHGSGSDLPLYWYECPDKLRSCSQFHTCRERHATCRYPRVSRPGRLHPTRSHDIGEELRCIDPRKPAAHWRPISRGPPVEPRRPWSEGQNKVGDSSDPVTTPRLWPAWPGERTVVWLNLPVFSRPP